MSNKTLFIEEFFFQHPNDAATILERKAPKDTAAPLNSLPEDAPNILNELLPRYAADVLLELDLQESIIYLDKLSIDEISMILRFVPKEIVKEFLEKLSSEKQKACELLLRYPLQCVGAWMQVEIITIHEDSTIQDAINLIKNYKREALLDLIYVLNDSKQLLGTSKISSILRDDPELSIRASLDPVLTPSISANSPLKAVKKHKYWETNDFLTIVDKQKKFIGILRHQDLLKALSTFTITDDTNFSKDDLAKEFCEVYSHSMVELFNLGSKVVFKPKHAN